MFGAPDADDTEIEAALTAAQARFARMSCPGAWTPGSASRAWPLSGGQRQPDQRWPGPFLAGPDVLILDDPLSALDVHTEERVTRALHEILAGRDGAGRGAPAVHRGARGHPQWRCCPAA